MPYYAYGRSDKKDQPRVPITARLVANLIEVAGADRVLTVDFHAGQIQGFFNIPVDELTAIPMLTRPFASRGAENLVVAATDTGGTRRARDTADILNTPIAIAEKQRLANADSILESIIIGDVHDKDALVVDDEISTGGTLVATTNVLREFGANDIYCAVTHGVLCGDATSIMSNSDLKEIFVTDTLPIPSCKRTDNMRVMSVAPLLGEAIHRIHNGLSVGAMFEA
jgi:ribose-phosphate pyrophosphokinase